MSQFVKSFSRNIGFIVLLSEATVLYILLTFFHAGVVGTVASVLIEFVTLALISWHSSKQVRAYKQARKGARR